MRRLLLSMLMVVAAATLSLKAQTIVIDDGFENGIQDSIWTQEFVVGQTAWAVEEDDGNLLYPSKVWQGKKRAYLRNTTGETQGYVTRLVSKVMDLSPEKVYQPELTFWYANPKWTADRDTLRVLYRTSQKAEWRQLKEFSTASADWQKVRLELPEVNATYQIAFEGKDNLGRGIVLDSVKLRSAPQCTVPHDITVDNKGNGKVSIKWLASWDANSYDLIITKDVIIDPDTVVDVPDSLIALRTSIDGLYQKYDAQLESGAYYYIYLRSLCDGENSMWNSEDPNQGGNVRFRVKATKYVPYNYGFNWPVESNTVRRDLEWTWDNNTGHFNPFVNVYNTEEERRHFSPDGTSCIVFTGANNTSTPIPANQYAYLATPAIGDTANANFALNQCQVRFWSTVYTYTGRNFAHSLIVGVMTDPEDITTFVPVDTVSVWGGSTFMENIVDLSSYQGEGAYVAFMSNFSRQNIFFIDDITIEYIPSARKVTRISVNPRDTYADITWEGNAPSYNVLITKEEVDPTKATAEQIVDQATVTTNSYKCETLEEDHSWNRPYFVYVQAVNGENKAEWSYRYPFVTIAGKRKAPLEYDFEQKSGIYQIGDNASVLYPTTVGTFSNDPDYPRLSTTNPLASSSCLNMTKDAGNDSWVTFPMLEDSLKDVQVKFYLSGSSTPNQAHATLGVMSNPMDISTFTPISDFTLSATGYFLCYANFLAYEGPEDVVIAIVWSDVDEVGSTVKTINYIDNFSVEPLAQCLPPVNIQSDAETDSVTISWDKSEFTTWEFILAKSIVTESQFKQTFDSISHMSHVLFADTITWEDPQTYPTYGFGGLTYNSSYYVYVRTLCADEKTWWVDYSFKTPCPDEFTIPYSENFEKYETGAYDGGVACLQAANYGTGTGYPKILNLTSGAQSGNQLELWSTSTTQRTLVMLPGLKGDLSNMALYFDTRSWSTSAKSVLYVGSMGDIADWTTFVPVDTFYNADGNSFQKVRMDLSEYTFAYNNIVFTSGLGDVLEMASDVMIDNILIKPNTCIDAWQIHSTNIEPNSIDIAWKGRSNNDEWIVKVTQGSTVIVDDSLVTGKAFHVEGLTPQQLYKFHIQTLCGDSVWTVDSVKTGCVKLDPTKPNKETFEAYPSGTSYKEEQQAPCWTVGNGNPAATTTYIPYIYKTSSTYAASGTNAYRLYPTATYSPTWVAAPEIDCESLTELLVTFSFYGSTSYYILPGVMTDPEDLSTFVVLDSIKGQGNIATISMDLSEYADTIPAGAKYFAWRTAYNAGPTIYLDDVSIIKITCPLPKPSYSGLTAEQVRISSGLRTDNDWIMLVTNKEFSAEELAYMNVDSLANDKVWRDSLVVYYDTLDVRSKVLTGLEEQTEYYVAIATKCDDGISQWMTMSVKTPCKPITPEALGTITFSTKEGYVTGSGATRYLPCWTIGNKSGNASATSTYIPYVYTSTDYSHEGNNVLRLYAYVPTSETSTKYDGAYAIMPELDVDDISKYQVSFFARVATTATYNNKLILGVVTDPSDLNTFTVIDTLTLSREHHEPFTISLENYQGDYLGNKGRYIMFLAEVGTATYVNAFVSEISVSKIPTCRPVTEFVIDSIAEDVAVISWQQVSDSYRIMMANKAVKDDEKPTYEWLLDSTVTHTDRVLISGLSPAKQYYLYAQALCDGGDSSAISMAYANFFTDCPVVNGYPAPYYTDFDNNAAGTGTGKKPDCWDGVYLTFDTVGTTQTYPYVYSIKASSVSEPYVMYMYSYGYWNNTDKKLTSNTKTIAVAPKISGNQAEYMVSFYAKKTSATNTATSKYGGKLLIGYVTDASQKGMDSTFVTITAVDVTSTTQTAYQVILSDYVTSIPDGARIALRADWSKQDFPDVSTFTASTSMYANFYVDNFKIGFPPSCFPPTLEPGNTTLYTADVNIIPAKEGNNHWQIAVVPDSIYSDAGYDASKYLAGDKVRIVDADSANFVLSGLAAGTKYWLYGRTICGGDDGNSAWADMAVSTRTKYYYKDSYFFGFEQTEDWERSMFSTSDTYIMHPAIETGFVQLGSAITSYSYVPHGLVSSSATYHYGYGDTNHPSHITGMRWNATASYYGQYVIFPALDSALNRSFEFKLRNGYSSQNSSSKKWFISTTADISIEIGTVDKYAGMDTYQKIATINMPALPTDVELTEANDWLWRSYTIDIDSADIANKQVVIFQAQKPSASCYPYVDMVTMGEAKGFGLVSLDKIQVEATKATITWDSIGGPWNLEIKDSKNVTVASFENLSGLSQVVTGLQPKSEYKAILRATDAPAVTKYMVSDTRTFHTPCLPLNADINGEFTWDFDDPNEWEASDILAGAETDSLYKKQGCFTVGTTYTGSITTSTVYYNWLIQRKGFAYTTSPTKSTSYDHYEVGRYDSHSLRIYTSSSYMTPYIVLPQLNCDLDTMMIEFWGRCFINYDETYSTAASRNKMVSATYLGASYSKSIVVGTLTDPTDFSTLEVIDTLTYNAYTSTTAGFVTDDPTGNRYWQKMQLPLAGTSGKYIVLFQPAYGLFFLDDLSVKAVGDNLFAPSGAQTGKVTATTADFSWRVKHPTIQSVVVVLNQDGDQEILRDTVDGAITTYTADGLTPGTAYQWYMYQTNGTDNTSTTPYLSFNTECVSIDPDYTTGFELEDGWRLIPGQTTVTYKQTQCWVYGNAGTAAWSSSYEGYNQANTDTYRYSHSGAYAVRMEAYSTTHQPYIASPRMDVSAYDTLQVNFWMRPGYQYVETHATKPAQMYYQYTYGSTASTSEYYYSKAIIVGTMMDPNDATTFMPIDTINYTGTFQVGDIANAANDYLFQKKKISLAGATGPYVAFMTTLYAKGETRKSTYDYMWLDDISFSAIQHCDAPEEMSVSDISATSAKLSWVAPEGADKYILQVSTDPYFAVDTAYVFNDTVYTNSHVVTGMEAHTDYVWRVRTICGEDLGESEFSLNSLFTTARTPFYQEDFASASLDADWSFGTTPALSVVDSTDVEITGDNNATYGFKRVTTDYGIEGAHYVVPCYTSSSTTTTYRYYWMISPVISLNETDAALMTMDMALTQVSTSTPNANAPTEANMKDDYAFMIIISDDGGKTWKKENIVGLWCNGLPAVSPVIHALRDIPSTATNLRIDLSQYAGKNIRVAFYREAITYVATNCGIHIGNIRINYFDKIEDSATACQYEDINKIGFYIDGDKAPAGEHVYTRFVPASSFNANTKGYRDTIYSLDVEYLEAPETIFADTICEGESYTDVNFTGKTHTGIYRRKVQSVLHCDSIITLHLFVAPKQESYEFDTICFGGTYTWHGKEYNQTGSYEDHLTTMYGCDSITHLSLYVRDQITGIQNQSICHGASYSWNGQVYDKTGEYKQTLTSVTGCDSIAILRLEVTDLLFGEPQKETVCHGLTFTWYNGKVYDTGGIYYDTIQSVFGCDSVNTLELTIAPIIQGTPVEVTICSGATYTWNGKTYAKAGTYTEELVSEAGCDSIATLILKVADILIGEPQKQSICEGASYIWNNKLYNVAGTYVDTIQSAGGCDSVATLVLSISSVIHGDPENISICEYDSLNWNGKIYKNPGTYVDTLTASYGCDSIATLVLTYFGEEDTIRTESLIALADLPFTYENAEHPYAAGQAPIYYAEGTQIGVYSDTVLVEGKNCTAVMIHTLTLVEKLEGVDNVSAGDFSLLPNIINAGETVTARGNFNGMVHIQVYDIVGRLIKDEQKDAATAITINAFPQSGIYTVRISDSTDAHYVGRVMAK